MPTGWMNARLTMTAHGSAYRRIVVVGATVVATITLLASPSFAAPIEPDPTIDQVTAEVELLYEEMEIAAEAHNAAQVESDAARGRLNTLRANLAVLRRELTTAETAAGAIAAAQYRGAATDPVLQLLAAAEEGNGALYRLAQLEHLAGQQADTVDGLSVARLAVARQEGSIQRETARMDEITATRDAARVEADAKHRAAQALLARLTAEEAARVAAELAAKVAAEAAAAAALQQAELAKLVGMPATTALTPPASPRAAIAIAYALAQVGDAYVWGAAGPDAYDCSGLTMTAWAAAGVALPHSSLAQSQYGAPVTLTELEPGDLVFYHSPVSHVGMYIGNGQIVHAANPLTPIGTAAVGSMPITGARRMG